RCDSPRAVSPPASTSLTPSGVCPSPKPSLICPHKATRICPHKATRVCPSKATSSVPLKPSGSVSPKPPGSSRTGHSRACPTLSPCVTWSDPGIPPELMETQNAWGWE
uniref:Uncharacterized protein n=1 Tax=Zonotrichia albicollis TaxID=44394 RepID=A0A8D2MC82_ZONAL